MIANKLAWHILCLVSVRPSFLKSASIMGALAVASPPLRIGRHSDQVTGKRVWVPDLGDGWAAERCVQVLTPLLSQHRWDAT